uniref:Uncharacterized protein LOC100371418 n=1 Tax=Saccoglossus kowalevskii TaxID=10224 RepID=A0ABM0GSC0_SACKO|nr:PREDICTED: uncharacterized protein LOC100371418 [Saccoglossus kowalevskii]
MSYVKQCRGDSCGYSAPVMWTVRKIIKASIIIYSLVFFITVAKQLCLKQFQNRPTSSNVKVREKNASNEDESGYFPESQIISTKVVAAVSADQVKNAPSNKLPLKTRYLLPVIHSGGQNVQFLAFKRATTFAYVHNRTIVATPFFLHGGDARGWTMEHWRDFNITFDTDVLQEIVPVATLEDFKAQCTGKIKALHVTLHGITKTAHILNNILKLGPISSENLRRISSSYDEDPLGDETCVAFLLPHDLQDPDREMTELIDSHFVRSPVIQRAVDAVCKHACNGGRLLAIHWRNRTGEPCVHFLHYPEVKAKCAKDLPFAVRAAHVVGHSLKLYMDAENYNCLFVAHPNYSMVIKKLFI